MKLKKFIILLTLVFIMIASSKFATNYYVVRTHIEPLSKNASLLTLLFMFFFILGMIMTNMLIFINRKQLGIKK